MIGLSLSFCVLDIANPQGKIPYKSVVKIITRTRFRSDDEFDRLMRHYRAGIWRDDPARCEQIARELRIEGKLEQPRAVGRLVPYFRPGCHWVAHEDFIRWTKVPEKAA